MALIDCFFAFRISVRWSLKSFPKSAWSCFCRNAAFSLNIEATCDEEVPLTSNNIFFLLSYVIVLLHCPINNTVFSKSSSTVSISTVLELPLALPEFTCSTITHSFDSGPIMSRTLSCTFSKVLSVAISCGLFFCFRSSCR